MQAEDGIRDLVRSRGVGDVYKRQLYAEAIRTYLDQRRRPNRTPGSWAGRFELHESEEDAISSDPDIVAGFDESADAAEVA